METKQQHLGRRKFIKASTLATAGAFGTASMFAAPHSSPLPNSFSNELNIIGPKEGYSPQIGTLVSMMDWMRFVILRPVQGMSVSDLDFLVDENANSIGAMLMHLAATERFYQIHTFENKTWGDWSKEDDEKWSVAMGLGEKARNQIKGNTLEYYIDEMTEIRENTLSEFKKRDDDWLMAVDNNFPWGPTNNYCKWFHVCEHESNHNGQFKFIKSRIS